MKRVFPCLACAAYLALLCMFGFSLFALGASEAQAGPSYRRIVPNPANDQSWRDGIRLSVELDVAACRRAYGESRYLAECQAPNPGRIGQQISGIRMTPQVPGTWRWESETMMHFSPKTHLAPDTLYTISLDGVEFPMRYALSKNILYRTPPQAVMIAHETFWVDPSKNGRHVVTIPLTFIWPMNHAALEKSVSVTDPKGSSLRHGPMRFVWNEGSDEVIVTIPISNLPEKNTALNFSVKGLPSWHFENSHRVIDAAGRGKTQYAATSLAIIGTDRVMDVKSLEIEPRYDDGLSREYQLVVTTSLATKPADVLDKLDIRLLPKKANPKASKDTKWENMPSLSQEDINRSEPVTASLLQPAGEPATQIRLRVQVPEGRGLMCAMKSGLPSLAGYTLNRVRRFIVTAPKLSPEINFLQPGNVLSVRKGQKIDIHSVGVDTLEWEAAVVRDPFLALVAQKTDFQVDEDLDVRQFSVIRTGRLGLRAAGASKQQGRATYTALDLPTLLGEETKGRLVLLELKGYAGTKEVASARRLILFSDIGLLLKTERNGSHQVFVQSVSTGKPLADATVRLLGANGLPVAVAKSSREGVAVLPSTFGLEREKKPSVLVAEHAGGFAWLPLDSDSDVVQYSDFSVMGRHMSEEGLIASVFTERGVYMPGETLHFGAILRNQTWTPLRKDLPVYGMLYDPSGNTLVKKRLDLHEDGLSSFAFTTRQDAPTGTYRLDVCLERGDETSVLGTLTTRVEEFQPDTLAMSARFETKNDGWLPSAVSNRLTVHLDNLYGEPAVGHRVRAHFHWEPHSLSFTRFPDYTFVDTSAAQEGDADLPEGITDDKGDCVLDIPADSLALGSYLGSIEVEGFEKAGGRAVVRSLRQMFSPREVVLGYKPEGSCNTLTYIPEGSDASLRLLAVDAKLSPSERQNIRLVLSERRFVTSLVSDSSGRYRYDATPVDTELSATTVTLDPKGTLWKIPTESAGDYLLGVYDGAVCLAQIPFTIAGNKLAKPGQEPALVNGTLRLTLDKEAYNAGDTIRFQIAAPYAGHGVVTLERDRVVAHAFFTAEPGRSVHEIAIPKDFEGKGYVNVSFIRASSSDAIYMRPHIYAVAPFTAGVNARDMRIELSTDASVLPGSEVTISISAREEGRVQVFLVDEGILQLTRYAAPNPIQDLLTDRALDVVTREAYHLVMPDHERLLGRIPGFGGDMGSGGGRFQNPFKRKSEPPFAYWSPVLKVGQKPTSIKVTVPSYFAGAFRVFAVGSGAKGNGTMAVGASSKLSRVRGSIILKPQLPLVAAPGDTFEGALVLANTVEHSGSPKIDYHMTLPKGCTLVAGKASGSLVVPENAERVVPFTLAVGDVLGEARVEFGAEIKEKDRRTLRTQSFSIRPASQKRATERARAVNALEKQGDARFVQSERHMYPFDASTSLILSDGSLLALRSVLDRLREYPYSCTEQKISMAYPHVVLHDTPALRNLVLPERDPQRKQSSEDYIAEALAAIRAAKRHDGVALWPGGETNPFVTAYAGDFLVSLQEHGLTPPQDLHEDVLSDLEDMVFRTPDSVNEGRIKIYAAWVLQRDGRIMTSQLNNLEEWFSKNCSGWEHDVLSDMLAASYATLRLRTRAESRLPKQVLPTDDSFFSTAVARALHTMIAVNTFARDTDSEVAESVQDAAFAPYVSTVDLAMSARALVAIARQGKHVLPSVQVSCDEFAPGFAEFAPAQLTGSALAEVRAPGCRRFRVVGGEGLSVLLREDGYEKGGQKSSKNDQLEVTKELLDSTGAKVREAALGSVVTAKVCARSLGSFVDNVALVDLVPGGLEPILEKEETERPEGLVRSERREDRMIFFVNVAPEDRCFTYRLRAASRGRFVVPAAQGSAMYQPSIQGISRQSTLDVR